MKTPINTPKHNRVQAAYDALILDRGREELNELYKAVHEQARAVIFNLLHQNMPELAADVTSTVLTKLHTFENNSKFSTWTHRIAYNEGLMYLRKHREQPADPITLDQVSVQDSSRDVENLYLLNQIEQGLTDEELELFRLFRSDMSAQDIAEILNVTRKHVDHRWRNLRKKIRRLYG